MTPHTCVTAKQVVFAVRRKLQRLGGLELLHAVCLAHEGGQDAAHALDNTLL